MSAPIPSPSGGALPSKEQVVEQAIEVATKNLTESLAEFEATRDPIFQGTDEFTRLIVGLSSGALVLSVSFAQIATTRIEGSPLVFLLGWSWVLFGGAVLAGGLRQWHAGPSRSARWNWHTKRRQLADQMRAGFMKTATVEEGLKATEPITRTFFEKMDVDSNRSLDIYWAAGTWMFGLFAVGLACLIAFAAMGLAR